MQQLHIMVVDDSPEMRNILTQRLAAHQHTVRAFATGDAAVAALAREPFDVVITDLKMPGEVDGIKLLEIVKERCPDTEVMIITGYATVETAIEALRKGAVDYFMKPFHFEELLVWVQRIARKREVLATLRHAERNREQGFSDLRDIVDSLYATCSRVEKILRNDTEPEGVRIEKALALLTARTGP